MTQVYKLTIYQNQEMKNILLLFVLLYFSNSVFGHQTVIGLSNYSIDVIEYWKFEDGIKSHQMLISNRTKKNVQVVVRKWRQRPYNLADPTKAIEPNYTSSDTMSPFVKTKPTCDSTTDKPGVPVICGVPVSASTKTQSTTFAGKLAALTDAWKFQGSSE